MMQVKQNTVMDGTTIEASEFDQKVLIALGLETAVASVQQSVLKSVYVTLENRVVRRVTDQLSDEQREEVDSVSGADDDAVVVWLRENVPDIEPIIAEELDGVMRELGGMLDSMNAAMAIPEIPTE